MIGAVRAILEKRIATLRSRTFENLVYNYIGVFWLNALSLIVIPMYVRALGPLEWGLIATCMSVQIFYSVIDSGLGQVLPKWIAQYAGDQGSQGEIYALFRKYYLIAGSTIIVIGQLAAHKFSHNVAQIEGKPADLLELSFRIVVLQLALQLINSVNIGYWSGRQEQKKANLRSIIFGTIKHILAMFAVMILDLGVLGYVTAFCAVALLELGMNFLAVKILTRGVHRDAAPELARFSFLQSTGLTTLAVVVGSVVAQLDRLRMINIVDPAHFGVYVVILNIAATFLQIQMPFTRAIFPRIVQELDTKSTKWLRRLGVSTILTCTIPCLIAALFAGRILSLWIGDAFFVSVGALPLAVLLIAVAINSIYNVMYAYFIARSAAVSILAVNLTTLVGGAIMWLSIPARLGMMMGAAMVVGSAIIQVAVGTVLFHRLHRQEGI